MDGTVRALFNSGVSTATINSYKSGITQYLNFCKLSALNPLPLTEPTLCRFAAHMYIRRLASRTIHAYLSSLRFYQIALGGPDLSLFKFPQLHYVLRGIDKQHPIAQRPQRLPITPAILRILHRSWSRRPLDYERVLFWAAYCLGFFAFLRAGEFTCSSRQAYSVGMLSPSDIRVDSLSEPTFMAVTLRQSKTDVFGTGVTLYLGRTQDILCPVAAVLAYMAIRPPGAGPLFIHQDGTPLSRTQLVSKVRETLSNAGLQVGGFSGHSFCIGAASTAAQAGIPDSLIQTLGRWKSAAFLSYLRTSQQQLLSVSRTLAHGN